MQSLIIPIWEDKGIIIGLFSYLTNNHDNLQNKTIIINNDIYGSIIKMFFTELKFKKKPKDRYKNKFFINIKSNALPHQDLYINNLNNFIEINNKKTKLLSWYDKDNPIVMFHYKKDGKHIDMDKLKEDITYFDNFIRYEKYNVLGMTKNKCMIDCWDTYYEIKILKKFTKLYVRYNVKYVNDMINKILLSPSCDIGKIAYIPVNNCPASGQSNVRDVIKYLPGETREVIKKVEVIKEVKVIEKIEVPTEVIKYKTDPTIIKILTDKLAEVNTILDLNLEDIHETK